MNRSCFIITGTSKGIGEHLSRMLLERGHSVVGIARGSSAALHAYTSYIHISYDLSATEGLEFLISSVIQQLDLENFSMIALINNASMLEPLMPIEQCSSEEMTRSLHVSFLAPMILTSAFMRHSEHLSLQRKVMNISSGSGTYPAPGMSVYCSAKAGLNMFTQCVGQEQLNKTNPVEIIAVDPGMVDTDMQKLAREQDTRSFELAQAFQQAYEAGQLISKDAICTHLIRLIEAHFDPGRLIHYAES